LGIMGKPMCKNLIKHNYELVVMDKVKEVTKEFSELGAKVVSSPKEVAAEVEVVITMLPDSPDVQEVVIGTDGIVEGASSGMTVIDMSSIKPLVSREIYSVLEKKGVDMLDASITV